MKILFIVPDFFPNSTGFANASTNLVNSIINYGKDEYEIWVFTTELLKNNQELTGVNVIRYPQVKFDNRWTHIFHERKKFNYIKKIINENSIDVIFFETNTFGYLQYWITKKYKKNIFVRIHSTADTEVQMFGKHKTINSKIEYLLTKKFMKLVPNIVSTSNYYLEFVKHFYFNDNVYDIWNNKTYSLLFNTSKTQNPNFLQEYNHTLMTMGKMSSNGLTQKGILDLIRAIYYLNEEKLLPEDFKLIIVGDGIEYPKIKNMCTELHLMEKIKLIKSASHEDILKMIESVRAIVLLSRYEGQSMFITESLSLGKALILSNNTGMQDMVIDGINGTFVNQGNAKDAAEKILRILNARNEEIARMGKESKALFDRNYSEESTYLQFDKLIKLRTR